MENNLKSFAANIAALGMNETGCGIALLWFLEQSAAGTEPTPSELAAMMHDLALKGRINQSRFAQGLRAHRDVIHGKRPGSVKLRLAAKARLSERFAKFTTITQPEISPHVLEEDFSRRKYLAALAAQINGTYQFQFYDGCAALCRRLMETLMIEAFERLGHAEEIKDGKNYRPLSELIGLAGSGRWIKLHRGSVETMEKVKEVGDTAAHHRIYITRKSDIDEVKLPFRRVISELMHIADLSAAEKTGVEASGVPSV